MKTIDKALFDTVALQAEQNPRRRMNYNFHETLDAPVNRLLNVMMTDTYLPPHRHTNPGKDEIVLVLQGSVLLFLFDDEGHVTFSKVIDPKKGMYGLDFDGTIWHTFVVLEPATVIYEVKEGPYQAITPDDFASWAPASQDREEGLKYNEQLLNEYYKQ